MDSERSKYILVNVKTDSKYTKREMFKISMNFGSLKLEYASATWSSHLKKHNAREDPTQSKENTARIK